MLRRIFLAHPREVGESYFQHQARALEFSGELAGAALACFVHALIPSLFARTASGAVRRLHDDMNRNRVTAAPGDHER
ncbi:MAG: DUF6356 family protein [Rhizomicrobium sp.]